jgi:hypothetical protein
MRTENRDKGNIRRAYVYDVLKLLGECTLEIDIEILWELRMQKTRERTLLVDRIEKCGIEREVLNEMLDDRFVELEEMEGK